MLIEMSHISENLDANGIKEGDLIILKPFYGREKKITINRTCIDFITENLMNKKDLKFPKKLDCVQKESLHIRIELVETKLNSGKVNQRYLLRSYTGGPFKLNGCLVLWAFLEQGDRVEVGHNILEFQKNHVLNQLTPQSEFLLQNKNAVNSNLPILLVGETGTGKSSLAQKIHESSGRRGRFVHLNLSSFSSQLIESELFGHIKGAFTGAIYDKKGAFKEAQYGTLFIDEIDSLPLEIQTKLLLFLDDYTFRAVGGSKTERVDTRLILSSGKDLMSQVAKSLMREDFYYRISSGLIFKLKPLRDNTIEVERFCQRFGIENHIVVSSKLIEFYKSLPWPGNYRQLKSHLEKKRVLTKARKLNFDDSDKELMQSSSSLDLISAQETLSLKEVKDAHVKMVFHQCEQDYKKAALRLSISSKSVRRIINETA